MKHWTVGVLAVVLLAGVILIAPHFLSRDGIPARGSLKLADLKAHSTNDFSFTCPANEKIWFVLGTRNRDRSSFSGTVTISGTNAPVCQHPFSSQNMRRCSWLTTYGLNGFVLCYSNESGALTSWPLREGDAYKGTISINTERDGDASLWLYWFGKQAER